MVALFFFVLLLNMPGGATTSVCNIRSTQIPMRATTTVHEICSAQTPLHAPTSVGNQDCVQLRLRATKTAQEVSLQDWCQTWGLEANKDCHERAHGRVPGKRPPL